MWDEIYDRVAALARQHRSTLIFVNTRRMSERMAHHLGERLGKDAVAAHQDRKSTRLNSSHSQISYAVFCLKKKSCDLRRFEARTSARRRDHDRRPHLA